MWNDKIILSFLLILSICSCKKEPELVRRKLKEGPSISIMTLDPESWCCEQKRDIKISEFTSARGSHRMYVGTNVGDTEIFTTQYQYEKDPDVPGNIILKFEITVDDEVFDIPQISWNQKDDVCILYGHNWLVKLTSYETVWNVPEPEDGEVQKIEIPGIR